MKPTSQQTLTIVFVVQILRLFTEGSLTESCSSMPPLSVFCTSEGVTGYTIVQCYRTNNIMSITCSIDGGEEENCTHPLTLTAAEIGLGVHSVDFTFTDECGRTAQEREYISWNGPLPPAECSSPPPLEFACGHGGAPGYVIVQCYTSNNLESQTCSIDWGEAEPCSFPLRLNEHELGSGQHTLFIRWTDTCGQTASNTIRDIVLHPHREINVGFEQEQYTAAEHLGFVELCASVWTVGWGPSADREFRLSILLTQGSSSFSDFAVECNNSLIFHEGDYRKCHSVTIHNDDICEWRNGTDEQFTAHLVITSGDGIALNQGQAHIHIDDSNEPECDIHVGYSRAVHTVSDGDGYIELCVQVTNSQRGAARPFSLSVFTSDGTAVNDANYVAVAGEELLFPTGVEGETLCHNVSIIKSVECSAADGGLNFTSNLATTDVKLILDLSDTVVVIDDHNETECGPISVGYRRTDVIVNETIGVVRLCAVILSGQHLRPFSIFVSTMNSTADGSDYKEVTSEELVFNTTDTEQCHYINITDDMECEYDGCESEFFMSQLSTDDYNVQLVNSTALIFIEDEMDEECMKGNISSRKDCDITPALPSSPGYSPSSSISGGVIAVIVFLPVIAALIIGTIVVMCVCRWRTKKLRKYSIAWGKYASSLPRDSKASDVSLQSSAIQELLQQLPKRMVVSKEQIHLSNTVGQGESGLVYKAYLDVRGATQLVAVKTGKALFSTTDVKKLIKEVVTMMSFDHPNVMSLIGVCLNREMPLLIMPFMANGSVLEYIKYHREKLLLTSEASETKFMTSRKLLLGMCHQIAKGMEYLAEHKFVHRDLAARNCMIDLHNVIKVADFGLTEDMYGTNYYRRQKSEEAAEERVPIRWMAPESIEKDIYNEKTDVWAFGVTCWEVFTCGRVPYHGIRALGLLAALKNGERLEKPNNIACSDEIHATIVDCWHADQQKRPRFSDLVLQLSNLLEQEAGYLDLGRSLSWRKHGPPQRETSRATVSTVLSGEEEEEVKSEEDENAVVGREKKRQHFEMHPTSIYGRQTKV